MSNPFGDYWKKKYLEAIKKAYDDGDISKASYYELKSIVEKKKEDE